jgi:hypothetical protein
VVAEDARSRELEAAVPCPHCGAQRPDEDHFCGRCGASLRAGAQADSLHPARPPRREHRDLTIPLDLVADDFEFDYASSLAAMAERTRRFDLTVRERLAAVAAEGWEPAEPVDWTSLMNAGRIEVRQESASRFSRRRTRTHYEAVTIRLRRYRVRPDAPLDSALPAFDAVPRAAHDVAERWAGESADEETFTTMFRFLIAMAAARSGTLRELVRGEQGGRWVVILVGARDEQLYAVEDPDLHAMQEREAVAEMTAALGI